MFLWTVSLGSMLKGFFMLDLDKILNVACAAYLDFGSLLEGQFEYRFQLVGWLSHSLLYILVGHLGLHGFHSIFANISWL
jgi:hypothetical protein